MIVLLDGVNASRCATSSSQAFGSRVLPGLNWHLVCYYPVHTRVHVYSHLALESPPGTQLAFSLLPVSVEVRSLLFHDANNVSRINWYLQKGNFLYINPNSKIGLIRLPHAYYHYPSFSFGLTNRRSADFFHRFRLGRTLNGALQASLLWNLCMLHD
jgi:hypothetical protein